MERDEFIKLWHRLCAKTGGFSVKSERTYSWNEELRQIRDQILSLKEDAFPYFLEVMEAASRNDPYGYYPNCGFWDALYLLRTMKCNLPVSPKGTSMRESAKVYADWLREEIEFNQAKKRGLERQSATLEKLRQM